MGAIAVGIDLGLRARRTAFDPAAALPGGTPGALYEVRPGYVFQDEAGTMPAREGDAVGLLLDRSANAAHAVQAGPGARPLLRRDSNGFFYLEFDGIDDFLRAAPAMSQPWERIAALRQVSWGANRHIFGGASANVGVLQQFGASAALRLFDGTTSPVVNADPVLGINQIVSEVHDGAASSIAINAGAPVVADYGAAAAAGITIGASSSGASFSAIRLYGMLMRGGRLTVAERSHVRTWLAARAGINL